jgi:hypothetical protein
VGRYSYISRYEMELLPTPPVPKMKIKPAVTIQLRDMNMPIRDTNWINMDARKIIFLP